MKAFLMYGNRDFGLKEELPSNAAELIQDLELNTLFDAMAAGDPFLFDVAKRSLLISLREPEAILYRQHILADCLEHPDIVREVYGLAVEAIERERRVWGWKSDRYPESTLHRSVEVLQIFVDLLKKLRHAAEEHGAQFRSEGFSRFFDMLARELDDDYMASVQDHLERLAFRDGILMSADLGYGAKGTNYKLLKSAEAKQGWIERLHGVAEQLTGRNTASAYTYEIADRDEAGFNALAELRNMGIGHVAAALAESTDHILSFFGMLRLELGFYVGCLNLRDRLVAKHALSCFPESLPPQHPMLSSRKLYDACLRLTVEEAVVSNDVAADGRALVMITGANRGGKSTFLRSIGIAYLMMQCGMFVSAESFSANVSSGIFTHFKREEDATMESGKLDEELSRMSAIIDKITPYSVVLLNESFASTNEREGSEIARQIVRALLETEIKVFYVTHMYDLAHRFYLGKMDSVLFLRAERLAGGERTFRIVEGEPLPTSYGEDLYARIFGEDVRPTPGASVSPV